MAGLKKCIAELERALGRMTLENDILKAAVELGRKKTVIASLDYLTRMEGTTGKELEDLYTRMVRAQQ